MAERDVDAPAPVLDKPDASEPELVLAEPIDAGLGAGAFPAAPVDGAMPDPLLAPFAGPDLAPEESAPTEGPPGTVLPPDEAGLLE